jgi:predicted nucleic acid-binding protein
MLIQLDTDFLIYALSRAGAERSRLRRAAESEAALQISAVAWYEFCRGPRFDGSMAVTPQSAIAITYDTR